MCLPFWVSCTFSFPLHTLTPVPDGVSGKFAEFYPNSKSCPVLGWWAAQALLSHCVLTSHACAEWSRRRLTKAFRITCKGTWLFEEISVLMAPRSLGVVSAQSTPSSPYCLACSQRLWNTCVGSFVRGILPCEIKEKLVKKDLMKKGLKINVEMWHMDTGTVWIKS